jgi:hypothetical protein
MVRAQSSYEQADQAGARRYDPGNLNSAREKLAQANTAAERNDMRRAEWLARQAELDADLAGAHARAVIAETAAQEQRASISALRDETRRSPPPGPPPGGTP